MKKLSLALLIIVANWWWWIVFKEDNAAGLAMIGSGMLGMYAARKRSIWPFIFAVVIMTFLQWRMTIPRSLTRPTGDEQRVIEERKSAYPPITWAPVAYWLEEKPSTIAVGRWMNSVFENLDLNQYFFANHPREGVSTNPIDKIPFVLLPVALIGLWFTAHENQRLIWPVAGAIAMLGIIGNQNHFGALSTWPLWVVAIDVGWRKLATSWYRELVFVAVLGISLWQRSFLFF